MTLLVRIGRHLTIPKYQAMIPTSLAAEEDEEEEKVEENREGERSNSSLAFLKNWGKRLKALDCCDCWLLMKVAVAGAPRTSVMEYLLRRRGIVALLFKAPLIFIFFFPLFFVFALVNSDYLCREVLEEREKRGLG